MEVTEKAEELGIIMSSDEIELGMICAIKATNREVLIDAINKMILYIPDGRYPFPILIANVPTPFLLNPA